MSGGSEQVNITGTPAQAPDPRVRLDWVDALKGIGIIAVVAGHVWTRGWMRDAIYSFHMPLFFILSGYTARFVPWRQFVPSLLRGLGLPFACFCLILLGTDFLIEGARGVRPIFAGWSSGIATILLATEKLRGPFTILWFIPCLLLARLGWNALLAGDRRADDPPLWIAMVLIFGLALVAQHFGHRSPFAILAVPGALLMIWAGALWRLWGQPSGRLLGALVPVALLGLFWFPPLNMKPGDLGWPMLSLLGAVAVTLLLGRGSQALPTMARHLLAALGRASLVIMYLHVAFIHYLAPYAAKPVLMVVALLVSWAIDALIRRFALARRLLLGESKASG